jgi:adenylosuccinate lyase
LGDDEKDPSEPNAYQRGVKQGETDQTLLDFGRHFAIINGSQEKTANALSELVTNQAHIRQDIQQMRDAMAAAERTVIATAKALADAEESRRRAEEQKRQTSEQRWSPLRKVELIVGVIVGVGGLVALIVALLG